MARYEFKLPDIGEGIAEGEIVEWRVKPGDFVNEDQAVVEVMTDKATVTIAAPHAGVVVETLGTVGETVRVHAVLVVFEVSGPPVAALAVPESGRARTNGKRVHSGEPGDEEGTYFNEKPLATPATRRFARERGVDLRRVPPSGQQGRVTHEDVASFTSERSPADGHPRSAGAAKVPPLREVVAAAGSAPAGGTGLANGPDPPGAGLPAALSGAVRPTVESALDQRIPVTGLRRRIAQKMSRSKTTAAHFTFVEECDATALKDLRARLKDDSAAAGTKLTFLPFVIKAVVAALKKHPLLNSTLDEAAREIVCRKSYNIGIATATEAGLLVPVVRDADRKSLLAIAKDLERLSSDARSGRTKLEDLQGGTFTVTSLGERSGLFATPIINYPEVAILGVHRMKPKPVVRAGRIEIGDVMLLSLSFDHRVVDGHVGAAFAYDVIAYLEKPERLLLELT